MDFAIFFGFFGLDEKKNKAAAPETVLSLAPECTKTSSIVDQAWLVDVEMQRMRVHLLDKFRHFPFPHFPLSIGHFCFSVVVGVPHFP